MLTYHHNSFIQGIIDGTITSGDNGYIAGWIRPDGKIESVRYHGEFLKVKGFENQYGGCYTDAYQRGFIRLAMDYKESRKDLRFNTLSEHTLLPPQVATLIAIVDKLDINEICGGFEQGYEYFDHNSAIKYLRKKAK